MRTNKLLTTERMKKTFLLLCALSAVIPSLAQVYYLPKTIMRVHLLVEKQTYTPGEFARYAEKYLSLSNIEQKEKISHRVIDCELSTLGVRDTTKCYNLRLKGKGETADVRLSGDGVLLAINDEPMELFTMDIDGKFASLPQPQTPVNQYLSADVLTAGSKAKKAELIAHQITELRQRRQLLATGEADEMPQDAKQLERMLNEIDLQCNALTSLFTGTIVRDTTQQTMMLCPDREMKREVLFRLSHRLGLVDKDNLAGAPYYITIKNLYPTNVPLPENKKGEHIYANVPGMAQVSIEMDGLSLGTFNIPLAQFGYVELRDGSIFKKQVSHMTFHPATGAVVKQSTDVE